MAYNYEIIDGKKQDVVNRLRGAVVLPLSGRSLAISGLTLVFTTPVGTATFAGGTAADIKTAIEAAHASLRCVVQRVQTGVSSATQQIAIYSTGGSVAINTSHASSTAAEALGIVDGSTVAATGVAKANIVSFTQGATPDLYAVLTES
jgi:hypothetical protein